MRIQYTIKLTPESRNEMIHTFGAEYRVFRDRIEQAINQGHMGAGPEKVSVRWLLESGRWDQDPQPEQLPLNLET